MAAVGPGDEVLDVATGTGDLAVELASRGANVLATDFSEAMLERARAKQAAITCEWSNAQALPYKAGRFAPAIDADPQG